MIDNYNREKKIGNIYGFTGGNYAGNVYDENYLCPAFSCMSGGNRQPMIIEDFYKKRDVRVYKKYAPTIRSERIGLKTVEEVDVNEAISTNGTDIAGTVRATYYKNGERNIEENVKNKMGYEGVVVAEDPVIVAMRGRNPDNPSDRTAGTPTEQRLEMNKNGTTNVLTTVGKDNYVLENKTDNIDDSREKMIDRYRIRKLTPREVWRLMDVKDEDYERAAQVNSATQLYKQGGNSIVVNVLTAIFGQLFEGKEDVYQFAGA